MQFCTNRSLLSLIGVSTASAILAFASSVSAQMTGIDDGFSRSSSSSSSSSQSSLALGPVPAANLFLTGKATGTSDIVVKNQKNVILHRFEGYADTQDIFLTKVAFASINGSINNALNYTLWVDTDGNNTVDKILRTGAAPVNGVVTFDALIGGGYVIPNIKTVVFEVHADIAQALTNNTLQVQFNTTGANYAEAETAGRGESLVGIKTNGVCHMASCQIIVATATPKLFQIVAQGNLYVTKDIIPNRNHQLLGGTLGDAVLTVNFRGQYEDINVRKLQFTSTTVSKTIDRLGLFKDQSTVTPFATASVGSCGSDKVPSYGTTFCAKMLNRELIAPNGLDTKVFVRPYVKSDQDGGVSGEAFMLVVDGKAVSNDVTGEGAVRAIGDSSSNSLIANNGNATTEGEVFIGTSTPAPNTTIIGNANVTVLSKIAALTNASSLPDGTAVPTGVSAIGSFKFTAAVNGNSKNALNKVTVSDLMFTVAAGNVTLDATAGQFKIYNKENPSTKLTCTPLSVNGTPITSGTVTDSFFVSCPDLTTRTAGFDTLNTEIPSGTDATFVLEAKVNPIPASTFCGDVKRDGWVNAADTGTIARFVEGLIQLDSVQKWAADVNGDGAINQDDVTLIGKFIALLVPSLSCKDPAPIPNPPLCGDLSKDARLAGVDTTLLQRFLMGLMSLDTFQRWAADVNGDGVINQNDVDLLQQAIVGAATLSCKGPPPVPPSYTYTLQTSIQNFDSINYASFGATGSHFKWIDKDNATATTGSFLWVEYPETTVKSTLFKS